MEGPALDLDHQALGGEQEVGAQGAARRGVEDGLGHGVQARVVQAEARDGLGGGAGPGGEKGQRRRRFSG
ncbi:MULTISPECIES: hypothetical protein [unclassified Streptomyces]|uniref:hypothetical protein n=1 Tax=unclassified Streptomyces TaxID=2593676 RepID=UPI0029CA316D|nr:MULTISPECIES: hypothetical protein [unclassified Streptomyces]